MKINVIKAFSGVSQCCWENIICSFFPARHKKFPSQLDKIGWFPSQLIKYISQAGIPRAFKSLDPKRPEQRRQKRDKTGFFRKRNHSNQPSYVCDYSLGEGTGSFFFFVVVFFSRPQSSEFLQPAWVEMRLQKVSNSQAKPLSITKFPSQLIETPVFLPASKIPLGNR